MSDEKYPGATWKKHKKAVAAKKKVVKRKVPAGQRKHAGIKKYFKTGTKRRKNTNANRLSKVLGMLAPNYYTKQFNASQGGNNGIVISGVDPAYFVGSTTDKSGVGGSLANAYTTTTVDDILAIAQATLVQANEALVGSLNLRIYFLSAVTRCQYTNFCNTNVISEHFICQFREDIPNVTGEIDIFTMLKTGWIQAGIADGAARLEVTPYQSPSFCEQVKILRVVKRKTEPGKTFTIMVADRHKRRINPGKYVMPADQTTSFLTSTQSYRFIKGSKFVITRFWASSGTTAAPGGSIENPSGELGVTYSTRIEYKHIQDERINLIETQVLGLSLPGATPQVMNPLTGLVVQYASL